MKDVFTMHEIFNQVVEVNNHDGSIIILVDSEGDWYYSFGIDASKIEECTNYETGRIGWRIRYIRIPKSDKDVLPRIVRQTGARIVFA